jgi:hypothetical protein
MNPLKQAARYTGKITDTMVDVGVNHGTAGELALASGEVVAKRMALGAAAMVDPLNADHAEFARMVPEKAQAFADAGTAVLQRSSDIVQQMANFAVNEMSIAMKSTMDMVACRTPAALVAVQGKFLLGWLNRSLSQSAALGAFAVRSQAAVMAPVHKTATANARRLKG